jgi:pimeloyl-ACP methyl ester carboxylesterase
MTQMTLRNYQSARIVCMALFLIVIFRGDVHSAECSVTRGRDLTFQVSPGVYINYKIVGEGARMLVAIHGFGSSLDTWNDIVPYLKSDYQLVILDVLGFGLSARPKGFGYTIRQQAEVVASFLEFIAAQSGGNPITLIGHSYGGSIAITALEMLRDRNKSLVDRLILIDALGFPEKVHFPLYINILRVPIVNRLVLNLTSEQFRARWVLKRVFFRRTLVTSERVCRYAQFFDMPGTHDAFIRTARQLGDKAENVQLPSQIVKIEISTLIIWGTKDRLIPLPQATLFHQAIQSSQEPVSLECGHIPHEEKPAETASLIHRFLDPY